ncbi:redox protein [Vibrio sp. 10N.286.49.C2]|uniref:thiol-disulfide oxidoreductase DCC family protein n=1 Tax=unclassified Vibrio TaxID=2614977 RepID=UPI000C84ACAD|nr:MULTISPECIES: DUF393 domain-containing protein [unclassified Vibrio]PMH39336.1 redox protein [Vibrio sp. 10N.286.49.C2]PMH54314.1 redox protein [Vibrio sp. 10N.286.49.B1]PMH79435.1 redox protein [Vibrio sp. 10N.286.48.B7]
MQQLTIFFDGTCPLCKREMGSLTKHDRHNRIRTVDIYSDAFKDFPHIDAQAANTILHALDQDNQLFLGLDATHQAWSLVGRGWIYAPLRWRVIKPLADKCYLYFARNRYRISFWITGKSRCDNDVCSR